MFRKHFSIQIENPCRENWENMLPSEQGRFCNSCSKQVVDFTQMSDSEIVSYFKHHDNVCGRMHSGQLDRNLLPYTRKQSVFSKAIAAVALLFQSFLAESQSQNIKPQSVIQQSSQTNKAVTPDCTKLIPGDSGLFSILIIVEDYRSMSPIENAKVFINGDSVECLTMKDGWLKIELPESLKNSSVKLKVIKDGYLTYQHEIILDIPIYEVYMEKNEPKSEIWSGTTTRIFHTAGLCQVKNQKDETKELYRKYPGLFREF